MKNRLFFRLLILAVITLVAATACKDYDDDVSGLQKQIDGLKSTVEAIQKKVDGGAVITAVNPAEDGVEIVLSDGKKYKITNGKDGVNGKDGKDGVNGKDGKDGSIITIGDNGNWFIDGKDTGKPSRGAKGETGSQGPQGEVGPQGPAGEYYMPNADGFWHKVVNGKDSKTDMKWLPEGTITAVWKDGVVSLYNVKGAEGNPIVLGSATITSLVLLPDFVSDEGGALPVMNFSPLVAPCGELAPSTLAHYVVNPSNATENQIDIENISFRYNNPSVLRAAGINPKAEFVSLKDGILTVNVSIDTKKLEKASSGKIDQVMLQVPLKNGAVISSDWARVVSSPISEIALVRTPKPMTGATWSAMELKKTVADAKKLPTTHPTVVDLAYNETLDMNTVVATMLKEGPWKDFNIGTYNLEYVYDLNDKDGKPIEYNLGDNETDQQKFIKLDGSIISTRVYDIDGSNPASIDRTPIVHVWLKSNQVDCPVVEGFVKINIVKAKVAPIPPVTIPVEKDVVAGCEDFELTVGTQQMNEEFYAKAKLSKKEFHRVYKWAQLAEGVGTIEQKVDPKDTESYNLVWTVTEDDLWKNVGKKIEKKGQYTYGDNVIEVTFTANVKKPVIELSNLLLDNYWDAAKTYITHNVAVPSKNATNADEATFANNINNAFKNTDDKLLDLAYANSNYAGYTYEYVFDMKQPLERLMMDDNKTEIRISVSNDTKQLLAQRYVNKVATGAVEVIAEIQPQAPGTGDILAYKEDSDLGKYLLNKGPEFMQARLRLVVKNECGHAVGVKAINGKDSFLVHFLRPVNVSPLSADNFVDAVDFGAKGSYLDIMKVAQLSDWRNYKKSTEDYNFEPNHKNYYDYYGVEAITVDNENIDVEGLLVNGTPLTKLPSTIEITQTAAGEVYDGVTYKYGRLTYKNNGANLVNEFTLLVPVTVTYKWGNVITTDVRVKVYPTTKEKVRAAKK